MANMVTLQSLNKHSNAERTSVMDELISGSFSINRIGETMLHLSPDKTPLPYYPQIYRNTSRQNLQNLGENTDMIIETDFAKDSH